MEEIVIPNLDDDEDDYVPKASFGASSSSFSASASPSDIDPYANAYAHRTAPSTDFAFPTKTHTTPTRPVLPKTSASYSVAVPTPNSHGFGQQPTSDDRRLGKFSNGSSSSLIAPGPGTSVGSTSGFLGSRKASLASLKNAFKGGNGNTQPAVPPVPALDTKAYGAPGYPALRNPFSRFDGPISPKNASFHPKSSRSIAKNPSTSSAAYGQSSQQHAPDGRKYSIASSHRSAGGRSTTSQGSSSFRAEDHPLPALPPIPMRQTPSRMGRMGSDASVFGFTSRRTGSVGGEDGSDLSIARTPAEEAIRTVFRDFKDAEGQKVSRICGRPLNTHPSLPSFLEAGVDAQFDALVTSLAHCGTRHARRVVDLLIGWCRDYCGNIGASEVRAHMDRSMALQIRVEDAAAILQARKASAARYILNRALIELLKLMPKDGLDQELGMSLENNVFNAYRAEKLEEVMQFPHRKAVSQLQIELLGQLSYTRFLTVSDRFIRELGKYASAAQPTKEAEARIEHLLKGMRYLKLRVYPENELELSAEFIQSLAAFFANAHGNTLKSAYAETFTSLLHPVIETATAEVNHPIWAKAITIILDRATAMASKARYWPVAFPLVVTALGVSPREVFMQQWQPSIDAITLKFKDRSLRAIAMGSFIRMLWVYLNRCTESATSLRKRLDHLIRVCFTSNGSLYPSELPLASFTAILHYVMTKQTDYGTEFVREFLQSRSSEGTAVFNADRSTALVRAVNYTLCAIEQERPAVWPKDSDFAQLDLEGFEASGDTMSFDAETRPEVSDLLKSCGSAFVDLLFQCDANVKHLLLSADSVILSGHSSSNTMDNIEQVTQKHGDVYVTYAARYDSTLKLLAALLDTMPRCASPDINFAQFANILCRSTFSADPNVCEAAGEAVRRIAQDPDRCLQLVITFREFVFETRHVFRDTFIGTRLLESQFERIIKLWLDLLHSLVGHQRVAAAQGEDAPTHMTPIEPSLISKIEGCALFLLCSTSVSLRKLAIQILGAARDFEGHQRRPSAAFRYSRIMPDKAALTRVLQILEYTPDEGEVANLRKLPWMNTVDRTRLDVHTAKDRTKLIQRIAESDVSKDGALWSSTLPYFIAKVTEQLPGTAQELRAVVSQLVLRLQAHVALVAGSGAMRGTPSRSTPSANRSMSDVQVLADHWRAYLSILCVTMPSTGHSPPTPPIPRTRDVIILNPETINSPGLFHYLTSLLMWEDTRFRDAAIYAMGSIGQDLLRPLSEMLLSVVRRLADGTKVGTTPRDGTSTGSGIRRSTLQEHVWKAVAHVFRLISPLILDGRSSSHSANLSSMIGFIKVTYIMLSERTSKEDYDLQSLRRWFCMTVENLTNALGKLDRSDRFLGEEMRGAIFKICYEWCHVGRRPDVAKARESHMLQAAADSYRGDRDRAQYLDDLQAKTKLLSAAAAEAMAGLCQGQLISSAEASPAQQASNHIVEPLTVLRWIRGMFSSPTTAHHDTARRALFALLKYNWQCGRLLDEVLHQSFGEGEQFLLDSSFFGVVADVLAEGYLKLPVEQVACLALSKLGHPVPDIRQRAFQLTVSLYLDNEGKLVSASLLPAIGSASANIYRHAQKRMAEQLASIYADQAFQFLSECTTRLSQLEAPRRQATLSILRPWMEFLDLASDTSELSAEDAATEHRALQNLVYLAIRFSDDHLNDIQEIFTTFIGSGEGESQNTTALVKFLFEQGGKRKSPEFVAHAQRIMACLAQSPAGDTVFQEICNFVEPSAMASLAEAEGVPPSPMTSFVNLDSIISAPSARSQTFSTGQLALLFAGELLPHRLDDTELVKRLPTLLHVALIHSDHTSSSLKDNAQSVLFQVLRAWICDTSNVPADDAVAIWASAEHKTTALTRTKGSAFWKADDMGNEDSAFLAPPKMTNLIMKILGILLPLQPRIRQQWGELALTWATSCPIRHLACRSFQVFRILSPRASQRMVSDILARLSSTIASESPEIQAFNQEVIRTFASVVQSLTSTEAYSYPQIFWCSVACLTTPFENEFTEVIELLSHVLDKTNLSDPNVVQQLCSFRPPEWVGPEPHLQALLLVGLRSSKTGMMTFDLIRRLTSAPHDELIDSPSDRLLHGFVAALPWMLHSTDLGEPNEELAGMALDLASIADQQGNASFSRLLTSFARVRFRAKDDFIRQASSLLRDYMSSQTHALTIITLLFGFVLNTHDWMREKSMAILKLVLQSPEAKIQLSKNGNELLQPLLRLVSTKHSSLALEVLDIPNTFVDSINTGTTNGTGVAGGGGGGSGGGEIFGPISESGWSVPHPSELSALTKENVHAVFNTCAVETRAASAHFSIVQFADIRAFPTTSATNNNQSQISLDDLSSPTLSLSENDNDNNASMGDLVGALHSLGQFFDDGLDDESPKNISEPGVGLYRGQRGHNSTPSDVSEIRVRAIMARGHQASISSPIYESPSHQTTNPFGHGQGMRMKHRHAPSDMTDSSITSASSLDGGENITQRLNFASTQRSRSNSNLNSNSNLGLGQGIGGRSDLSLNMSMTSSHSQSQVNLLSGQGAQGGQARNGNGNGHIPNLSFSSTSLNTNTSTNDQPDTSTFGLDEDTSIRFDGSGTGSSNISTDSLSPEQMTGKRDGEGANASGSGSASEQNTPVMMKRAARFGVFGE